MKRILYRIRILGVFTFLTTLNAALFISTYCLYDDRIIVRPLFILLVSLPAVLSFWMLLHKICIYRFAKMIYENSIFQIESTKESGDMVKSKNTGGGVVFYISCFGILLDDEIIKFNIDGIQLTKVLIENRFIRFYYSGNGKDGSIRLLHGGLDAKKRNDISARILYETGVRPEFIKESGLESL